ncbi:MAG: DUF6544 family protein [Tepidanaerobacteraceae bacterium]
MSKIILVLIGIVILFVLFIVGSYIARFVFYQNIEKEVEEIFSKVENKNEIVTKEDVERLPKNVQKWLQYSGVIGKKKNNSCSSETKSRDETGRRQGMDASSSRTIFHFTGAEFYLESKY